MKCPECDNDMELEARDGYSIWVCEVCDSEKDYEELEE